MVTCSDSVDHGSSLKLNLNFEINFNIKFIINTVQ
jgi:hypothetical protein